MERLFIYGTMMLEDVQLKVVGRFIPMQHATLKGYRKTSIQIGTSTYPQITVDTGATVQGAVIELNDIELANVDEYEGSEYVRIAVMLEDGKKAWVYTEPA